jgi:hypothetical protein
MNVSTRNFGVYDPLEDDEDEEEDDDFSDDGADSQDKDLTGMCVFPHHTN